MCPSDHGSGGGGWRRQLSSSASAAGHRLLRATSFLLFSSLFSVPQLAIPRKTALIFTFLGIDKMCRIACFHCWCQPMANRNGMAEKMSRKKDVKKAKEEKEPS